MSRVGSLVESLNEISGCPFLVVFARISCGCFKGLAGCMRLRFLEDFLWISCRCVSDYLTISSRLPDDFLGTSCVYVCVWAGVVGWWVNDLSLPDVVHIKTQYE